MEINGKIVGHLPEKSGQSSNGPWRKQEFILETESQYPKKICFTVWGDKIDEFSIKQGENLQVSVDLESREYNERWYTDVKAWKVSRSSNGVDQSHLSNGVDGSSNSSPYRSSLPNDDIPF